MDTRASQLERLRRELARASREAFDTAYAINEGAGLSAEWGKVCERYGVAALAAQERDQVRAAQRPERGAAVMEFERVVERVVRLFSAQLRKIDTFDASPEEEREHDQLTRLLDRLSTELATAYRGAVLPKRQGMFGNVLNHAQPSSTRGGPAVLTLRCQTCGAPRLKATDLTCAFCGAPIGGTSS